jgi:hypothetical protein
MCMYFGVFIMKTVFNKLNQIKCNIKISTNSPVSICKYDSAKTKNHSYPHNRPWRPIVEVEVKVEVTLRQTVSRPVLVSGPHQEAYRIAKYLESHIP